MIPIRQLIKWAPKTALGCAAGAVVSANKNRVVPPKDASISGELLFVVHRAKLMATEEPSKTHNKRRSKIFTKPGHLL
jgi:hypothetical protein